MRGFSLHLADGSRWWIAGSPSTAFLAEKMGTIMRLQEGDGLTDEHILFFYDKYEDKRRLELSRLQEQNWLHLNPSSDHIHLHPSRGHFLGEYDSKHSTTDPYALMSLSIPSIFLETIHRGGLPFHAALLERHGQGIILAGRGDIGKSTCCQRLPQPWQALCDDEVLLVLSPEGRYLAHPFPTWSDYLWKRAENTWKVEDALPLAGIFFIKQAPEDDCLPLGVNDAALGATFSAGQTMFRILKLCDPANVREIRLKIFANGFEIVKHIPAFHLRVSLTGRFWEKIEAALGWR